MSKPSLNIENNHPAFAENHKKNSNKTKSRKIQKKWNVFWYQKEDKVKTKNNRRLKKKIIDKSRRNKRQLKNMESGIRTPVEEERAYYEVEDVLFYIQMDGWLNENLETFTQGFPMIPKEYWLSLRYYR